VATHDHTFTHNKYKIAIHHKLIIHHTQNNNIKCKDVFKTHQTHKCDVNCKMFSKL